MGERVSPAVKVWVGAGLRVCLALVALVVGVVLARAELLGQEAEPGFLFTAAVAGALVAFLQNAVGAVRGLRAPEQQKAVTRALPPVYAAMLQVSEKTGVRLQFIGISVFAVRRRGVLLGPRLVRVLRARLDPNPEATKIRWVKGKGAIGCCWRESRKQFVFWEPVRAAYGSRSLTEAEFRTIPDDERASFTREEFVRIADKYADVAAFPRLSDAGDIVGVISVDIAGKAGLTSSVLENSQDVEDIISLMNQIAGGSFAKLYPVE